MNKDFKTIMDWIDGTSDTRKRATDLTGRHTATDTEALTQATLYVGDTIMTVATILVELLGEVKKT